METKVQKWGNSLAVRFPKTVTAKAHLRESDTVDIEVDDEKVVLLPKATSAIQAGGYACQDSAGQSSRRN